MASKKKKDSVIAICIQEPQEDGSSMDFGPIQGDNVRFLHQAFISDTIVNAGSVEEADVRLYYVDTAERKKLVGIIVDYLTKKLKDGSSDFFKSRFEKIEMPQERWGLKVERVFQDCFAQGYKHVLVVGSRTPTISGEALMVALRMLRESDAVFGPTPEGRYYVIGMSGSYKISLSEHDWKSAKIYSEVAEAFSEKGLAWSELEIWYCVETSDDLEMMIRDINQFRFEGDELTAHETEKVMERILTKLEP
jgi:hypothetical protein